LLKSFSGSTPNFGPRIGLKLGVDKIGSRKQPAAKNTRRQEMENVVAELSAQLSQLSAQLKLVSAQNHPKQPLKASPWLPLRDAAPMLHYKSARALKARILRGTFPPDCYRQMPSPSGKRHSYLVNVERYLKMLR
jgi:hypothetical protein